MALTKIEWTARRHPLTGIVHPGYTFNPWIGCTKKSPACRLCYAKGLDDKRFSKTLGGATMESPISHWGKGAPRHRTGTWRDPLAWNREAERAGIALAVFCGSLCDWADPEVSDDWRDDLFADVVLPCGNLEWLMLTKSPDVARRYFSTRTVPPNVRMGATMENQHWFDARIHDLLAIDAPLGHFASMEPLLGPVDLTAGLACPLGLKGACDCHPADRGLQWVIVGGESCEDDKSQSEPTHPDDALMVATQCWAAGVAFTFKQWGDWAPAYELDHNPQAQAMCVTGKVPRRDLGRGEGGRRLVFNLGKRIAGRTFEGRVWDDTPPTRSLPPPAFTLVN